MPRINEERTKEVQAWNAHHKYLEEHFPDHKINEGWYVDGVDGMITSKVYGWGFVTTWMEPPYDTQAMSWEDAECAGS